MSPSPKHQRTKPTQSGVSPAQHARVREQLKEILNQINSGQLDRAGASITQLLRKYPRLAEVNHVASGLYAQTGAHDQAIYYATKAAQLDPSVPEYHSALGTLMIQANKHTQSIEHLRRALSIEPGLQQALGALGIAYLQTGQINAAKETLDQSIARFPDDHESIMNRALLESDIANAHQAVELMRTALLRFPDNPVLHDSIAMFACYDDQLSPEEVFKFHQAFGGCVQRMVRPPHSYPNTPDPQRRIRIGFVSPDFKEHSIAYFIEPLFEQLDRTRFELCIYSTSAHNDQMTARIMSCSDLWRDCHSGIAATHKQIMKDRPDILVELTGHFASNLLPIFGARPAPVSVSMIGYANTTGLESIDARIVDDISDPSPQADALATEKLIRTPGCFLCYRPPRDAPEPRALDATRPFTFGSFNDLRKMSPSCLVTWSQILKENPGTRLVLKSSRLGEDEVQADIYERFANLGIDRSRVDLLGRTPTTRDHLALYNSIDCALDTFPYTGTTTTCESVWMGVPTITLLGESHAGRVSASLLTTLGRDDLVAKDQQEYIELASQHAGRGPRSIEDRGALRDQLKASPLVDEASYARKIEQIFEDLWQSWCRGQEQREGTN